MAFLMRRPSICPFLTKRGGEGIIAPFLLTLPFLLLGAACDVESDIPAPERSPDDIPSSQIAAALTDAFRSAAAEGFSGVALVRYEGEVLLQEAAGMASRQAARANTLDTPFDIGSVTKQFTGAAILVLEQQGALRLSDPLSKLFTDVPEDKAGITVHQLLTHTAGLVDAVGNDEEELGKDEFLDRVFTSRLYYEPGTVHYYSNAGYSVLAAIIEELSGGSYGEFLQQALFTPAGMTHTGFLLPEWDPAPAVGYAEGRADDSPLDRAHDSSGYTWSLRGNGGILSTAGDLLRWHDALESGLVLDAQAVTDLQSPHVDEGIGHSFYGYGWVNQPTSAGELIWHDGGNDLFFAQVRRYLDADLQVVTLSNVYSQAAEDMAATLAEIVLPDLVQDHVEWDVVFEDGLAFQERTEVLTNTVTVHTGEEHAALVGAFLESGEANFRVYDPEGALFFEDTVLAGQFKERAFAIEERDGEWTLELELISATGDAFFAWGKRL